MACQAGAGDHNSLGVRLSGQPPGGAAFLALQDFCDHGRKLFYSFVSATQRGEAPFLVQVGLDRELDAFREPYRKVILNHRPYVSSRNPLSPSFPNRT